MIAANMREYLFPTLLMYRARFDQEKEEKDGKQIQ